MALFGTDPPNEGFDRWLIILLTIGFQVTNNLDSNYTVTTITPSE